MWFGCKGRKQHSNEMASGSDLGQLQIPVSGSAKIYRSPVVVSSSTWIPNVGVRKCDFHPWHLIGWSFEFAFDSFHLFGNFGDGGVWMDWILVFDNSFGFVEIGSSSLLWSEFFCFKYYFPSVVLDMSCLPFLLEKYWDLFSWSDVFAILNCYLTAIAGT